MSIIRRYDIRGVAETELTDEVIYGLGRAYGTVIRRSGGRRVSLGRDARLSGPRIQAAFAQGVVDAGVDVLDLGLIPTPTLYFSLFDEALSVDGGVIVTGSHNPADWNGLKVCQGTANLHGAALQALGEMRAEGDFEAGKGRITPADGLGPYLRHIERTITPRAARPLKVVVDAGNGTGGVAVDLYRRLGFEVIPLYCDPDGRFPNHHPDPTVEAHLEDLKHAVIEAGADLGLAFDGDSDRLGAVDHLGRVVWGDQLLLFFAQATLKTHPGARIIGEVKCSKLLFDGIKAAGGVGEMWKVGHALIKDRMRETGAALAGEMSGHFFFADRYFGFDDALYAGARLLELLSHDEITLAARLDALPKTVTTPEIRLYCPDEVKFEVAAAAAAYFSARYPTSDLDGARIDFPDGWGLIRPSNTQPVLVMRFEAEDQAALLARRAEVEGWLRQHAPAVDFSREG
ncbi:phosphomannomutase/phosphoglucomutase [Myxococcota bacterium]|nr:phosphomannomutase/phosphoglucomutase [Myxococcota bacterium]